MKHRYFKQNRFIHFRTHHRLTQIVKEIAALFHFIHQGSVIKRINHTAQIFLTRPNVSSCERHGCHPLERFPAERFFVIPHLSQLWEKKNYCERRNELSWWRPVALPNRHRHLCLWKLGCEVLALLSSDIYIHSGENLAGVYYNTWEIRTPHRQITGRAGQGHYAYDCSIFLHVIHPGREHPTDKGLP